MPRALKLALAVLALLTPALAGVSGWFSPSNGDATPRIIGGTGGPMDGASATLLDAKLKTRDYVEDFDTIFLDWGTLATPWTNSGWTLVNDSGTSPNARFVGGSVLAIIPGIGADGGINIRHNGRSFMSDSTSVFDGGHQFNIMRVGIGTEVFWYPTYTVRWQTTGSILSGCPVDGSGLCTGPWDSDFFIGLSKPDQDILVDATGALTCGTSWVADGGWGFWIDRSKDLRFVVCAGSSATTRGPIALPIDDTVGTGGGSIALSLGMKITFADGSVGEDAGECAVQAFYATNAGYSDWLPLGSEIRGAFCPTSEANIGNPTDDANAYSLQIEHQVGFANAWTWAFLEDVTSSISNETGE